MEHEAVGPKSEAPPEETMRVVVVDDEEPARRRLIRMLAELPVEVVGEAENGIEALRVIDETRPDLLFLDIRMPELDGLALAAQYAHLPPVVFVTAYEGHAIDAFEVNALDYLLKPVRQVRLQKTLARVKAHLRPAKESFDVLPAPSGAHPRVVVHDRGITRLFDAQEITRFWSANKYTVFRMNDEEHLTSEPLNALETRLTEFGFMRVHRAELVRLDAVKSLQAKTQGHEVLLQDGQTARVSRRLVATLKQELGLSS